MIYDIPTDTNQGNEKIIGGVLTAAQFFWLISGLVVGLAIFSLVFVLTKLKILSILLGLIAGSYGIPFAFYKKHEMTLFFYLKTKRKFNKKSKKLINKRSL